MCFYRRKDGHHFAWSNMFQTWHSQATNVEDPRDGFKHFSPLSELFWSKFFILLVYLLVFFKKVANLIISPEQLDNLFFQLYFWSVFLTRVTWMRINVPTKFMITLFRFSSHMFTVHRRSKEYREACEAAATHHAGHISLPTERRIPPEEIFWYPLSDHVTSVSTLAWREIHEDQNLTQVLGPGTCS